MWLAAACAARDSTRNDATKASTPAHGRPTERATSCRHRARRNRSSSRRGMSASMDTRSSVGHVTDDAARAGTNRRRAGDRHRAAVELEPHALGVHREARRRCLERAPAVPSLTARDPGTALPDAPPSAASSSACSSKSILLNTSSIGTRRRPTSARTTAPLRAALAIRRRRVDHVHEQVGGRHFFERRMKRGDELMRQPIDEPDRVGQQHLRASGSRTRRISGSSVTNSASRRRPRRARQQIEQRGLARVRVADERDRRHIGRFAGARADSRGGAALPRCPS